MGELPRLYRDLASWRPVLSAPEDHEEEAGFLAPAVPFTHSEVETGSCEVFLGVRQPVAASRDALDSVGPLG